MNKRVSRLPTHRVCLMKDSSITYPELWWDVFVIADNYETPLFAELFARAGCTKASSIDRADLVVFGGGADVDPILYGESSHPHTSINPDRDQSDMKAYQYCLENGIPMVGVCRGAQFLHVMNGGKLFQHVDNHGSSHQIWDHHEQRVITNVSSVHHQLCRPNEEGGMQIVADVRKSYRRWLNDKDKEEGLNKDIEAFFYRDTCCFGVQGHPEYRDFPQYSEWFLKKIQELIAYNPDLELREVRDSGPKQLRMKKGLIDERIAALNERKIKELM